MDVAILDFGSQYTNLIRAQLDDLGVSNAIVPSNTPLDLISVAKGVIISGGPASVLDADAPAYSNDIFGLGLPILGICYGHQLMAYALGGGVVSGASQEYGRAALRMEGRHALFSDFSEKELVWMSHGDTVTAAPPGFVVAGSTSTCPVAAMYDEGRNFFGVQFHPEVSESEKGAHLLERFAIDVCGCEATPNIAGTVEDLKKSVRSQVADKSVLLMLSGGVDSNVAFALLAEALGKDRVLGVHIDTGLLRVGETEELLAILYDLGLNDRVEVVDAADMFFDRLCGVTEPEKKREIIAKTFLDAKDMAMRRLDLNPNEWILGQGTIYTDLITSGLTENSKIIKTHHNSLLQQRESMEIIEPLRMLYKHQVRAVGAELGLPHALIWKEPYPGPGNGVRILGEVTPERAGLQREIDSILIKILREHHYEEVLFQGFPVLGASMEDKDFVSSRRIVGSASPEKIKALELIDSLVSDAFEQGFGDEKAYTLVPTLLPFQTVGIKGDNRALAAPVALRWQSVSDGSLVPPDYSLLERISSSITNKVESVTRVVLDITPAGSEHTSWGTLAFLRIITSREAMTADWTKIDFPVLNYISREILRQTSVDRVFFDVTQKPPGMIEWE